MSFIRSNFVPISVIQHPCGPEPEHEYQHEMNLNEFVSDCLVFVQSDIRLNLNVDIMFNLISG
jgi:hypothetical protein